MVTPCSDSAKIGDPPSSASPPRAERADEVHATRFVWTRTPSAALGVTRLRDDRRTQ